MNLSKNHKVKLVCIKDESTGDVGLVLDGMEQFNNGSHPIADSGDGILIAHDLLEHSKDLPDIGGIEDELIALGGAWYVRGEHGDVSRGPLSSIITSYDVFANDFKQMLDQMSWFEGKLLDTDDLSFSEIDSYIVEQGDIIISHINFDYLPEELTEGQKQDFINKAPMLFALGYHLAKERFKENSNQFAANTTFWDIAEAIKEFCKEYELFEGQAVELTYSIEGATIRLI